MGPVGGGGATDINGAVIYLSHFPFDRFSPMLSFELLNSTEILWDHWTKSCERIVTGIHTISFIAWTLMDIGT